MLTANSTYAQTANAGHYADINGLHMYYELHGEGPALVLIHGGGSTINTSFSQLLPALARHYQVIAVEMQAHGRTNDRNQPLSFEQDADDVSALLDHLNIKSAAIFGFSNGATTALLMAIRHPQQVTRVVAASGAYKRTGCDPRFWEGFQHASLDNMPQPLKDAYLQVAPDPKGLQTMFNRDVERMRNFEDMKDEEIRSITVPVLVLHSDHDVSSPEHAVETYRLLQHGELAILPGGHGEYMGAAETSQAGNTMPAATLTILTTFLDKPIAK
ncbi:alpha/beta fold hydrolase [Chitinophaga agrisoli]|nr:alpha/beta hydrolase [Chitinophaga agrisoli]